MRLGLIPGLLILASAPLHAEVEVRVAGDRVSVRAVSAPVSEILDRLARQTGMRLVYDAAPPRQPLTATLEGRTPVEIVLSVLEGLGLNYALVMDQSGARVDQLLILGAQGTPVASNPTARPAQPSPAQRPTPAQEEDPLQALGVDDEEEDDPEENPLDELERNSPSAPATPPAPGPGPRPPEYPSSTFTPRLPIPTPAPAPTPTPAAQPTPQAPKNP